MPTEFIPIGIAVLSISDSRTLDNDKSGDLLAERIKASGHNLIARDICRDNIDDITKYIKKYSQNPKIQTILTSGGTGVTGRDVTPEALLSLGGKQIEGFGELFRMLSYNKIGASAIQSRALAITYQATYIFALPGSPNACKDAWDGILKSQLDSRTKPCNFIELQPRLLEQ